MSTSLPVYVIHWNAPEWCESAAATIRAAGATAIVVHNGGRRPDVDRIIDAGGNRGFAGGANIALRDWLAGSEPWCVIASHDLHVEPDTFDQMIRAAAPGVGIIGPTLSGPNVGPDREWLSGSCLMISRECASAIGFFDERFGSYVEDVDYCLRARDAGFALKKARARATTLGSVSPNARRLMLTNQVLLARKREGRSAALRRVATHLKESAYRASVGERARAKDHLYAAAKGARYVR